MVIIVNTAFESVLYGNFYPHVKLEETVAQELTLIRAYKGREWPWENFLGKPVREAKKSW